MRSREKTTKDLLNVLESKPTRKKWITTLFILLCVLIFGSILSLTIEKNILFNNANINVENITKIAPRTPISVKNIVDEVNENIKLLYRVNDNNFELNKKDMTWKECISDSNFYSMYTNKNCMGMWLSKLAEEKEYSIDMILGVMTAKEEKENKELRDKAASNGGVRITLSDGTQGYWKPCTKDTGRGETYIGEIVSFWVDRVMGFYHTPAVVPRYFSRDQLLALAHHAENREVNPDKEATRKVLSYLTTCGCDFNEEGEAQGVEGAFIGWSPFPISLVRSTSSSSANIFFRFSELDTEEKALEARDRLFQLSSYGTSQEKNDRAVEVIAVHLYAMLVGNLKKFDHNLFIAKSRDGFTSGPFVYIDNDRSSWLKNISSNKNVVDKLNPFEIICKFPRNLADRLEYFNEMKEIGGKGLGAYLLEISEFHHLKFGSAFDKFQADVIDQNVEYLAKSIRQCIAIYGEDEVYIDESWPRFL